MTKSPTDLDPCALPVLEATPTVLRAMLSGLPESTVSAPGPEGWSPRDVVAHLASRQRPALIERIGAILARDGAEIPDIPEELSLERSGFRAMGMNEVLDAFEELRAEAMVLLRSIGPEQLSRRGRHSVAGDVTVADLIHHLAYHDLVHIAQAAQLVATPLEERRGAMRMF